MEKKTFNENASIRAWQLAYEFGDAAYRGDKERMEDIRKKYNELPDSEKF